VDQTLPSAACNWRRWRVFQKYSLIKGTATEGRGVILNIPKYPKISYEQVNQAPACVI
jgi:hypothetical protein